MASLLDHTKPLKRLPLSNDVVFKALFCQQLHLLADLINAVRYGMPPITIESILNPNILPEHITGKQIVLDILARDADDTLFMIEMQLRHYAYWPQRHTYYMGKGLSSQLASGQDYQHLKPAIGIGFLAHNLFLDQPDKACWHFTLRDTERPEVQLGESLQLHIIELRKAELLHGLPPALSAWISGLLHSAEDDIMSQITYPPVKEAMQHLEALCSDEELRIIAERREMAIMDERAALDYARTEGLELGREESKERQAKLLAQQLTHKFGPLSQSAQRQLSSASIEQLDAWALSFLDAPTLDAVFTSN